MKCLLSDAMIAHTASHPPSVHSTPPSNGSSPASANTSSTSPPLSQANASLLANSPAGSGDGAVNKRSIAEAQGAGDTRIVFQGPYHKFKCVTMALKSIYKIALIIHVYITFYSFLVRIRWVLVKSR